MESSAESFADIPASALLRLNLTAEKYCCNASGTASCHDSQYGMTREHSTADHGEDSLTSLRADSLVRTFPVPEKAPASTGPGADSGERCGELLARYDRNTCSWKTSQRLLFGAQQESLETWPEWAMWDETGCWALTMPSGLEEIRYRITKGKESGSCQRIPTPTVCGNYNRKGASKTSGDGFATFCKRYPTPRARDWKGMSQRGAFAPGDCLPNALGGRPNPEFAEWLMGWPIGWTSIQEKDCGPLAMDRFLAWLKSHGVCLENKDQTCTK